MKKNFTFLLVLIALKIYSQSLNIDFSFGNSGFVLIPETSEIAHFDYDQGGNIICVGYTMLPLGVSRLTLARTNVNGQLDQSFGNNGVVKTQLDEKEFPYGLLIQNDSKIIVCGSISGSTGRYGFVIRYNTDGTIDQSFATNGVFKTSTIGSVIFSVTKLSDDKILLDVEKDSGTTLMKLTKNGVIDQTFGNNGELVLSDTNFNFFSQDSPIVLSDSKILFVGTENSDLENAKIAYCKIDEHGNFDTTFGQNGKMTLDIYNNQPYVTEYLFNAKENTDKKITVNGNIGGEGIVVRINQDGTLDTTFGNNGIVDSFYPANRKIEVQPDGKVILGKNKDMSNYNVGYSLERLQNNGIQDLSFNNNVGHFDIDYSSGQDYLQDMKLQSQTKLLVAGSAKNTNGVSNFALVRVDLNNDLSVQDSREVSAISVYPNPVKNLININTKEQIVSYEIYDINANKILFKQQNDIKQIDVSALPIGNYILKLKTLSEEKNFKIIKSN